jgi:hypothetical protein
MRRALVHTLLLALPLGAIGCGGTTTGVELHVSGADNLSGDQLRIAGSVDGMLVHESTVPSAPRRLGSTEDVRILFADGLAGHLATIETTVLQGGHCVGVASGFGVLVLGRAKEVDVSFSPETGGCPVASSASDGGP